MQQGTSHPQPVAVFDYDGTCIDGQSGKLIATWLLKKGYLSAHAGAALAWWGVRYKLHMPYRQEHARELIFRDLSAQGAARIEEIMVEFHNEILVPRYRERAIREVALRKSEGCTVILVSATFETIAREAAAYMGANGYVATQMEIDASGSYTGHVEGDVIAGAAKVLAAQEWADAVLGEGTWSLEYAYGDHHSDIELLGAVTHPCAVNPGPTLKRTAREHGWPIVDWKEH